jgi:hypothetical protein
MMGGFESNNSKINSAIFTTHVLYRFEKLTKCLFESKEIESQEVRVCFAG